MCIAGVVNLQRMRQHNGRRDDCQKADDGFRASSVKKRLAAALLRRSCTRMSNSTPCLSTARHSSVRFAAAVGCERRCHSRARRGNLMPLCLREPATPYTRQPANPSRSSFRSRSVPVLSSVHKPFVHRDTYDTRHPFAQGAIYVRFTRQAPGPHRPGAAWRGAAAATGQATIATRAPRDRRATRHTTR
jgi:hypothetical protein